MTQLITRNGLPPRYSIDGFKQLCVDDTGHMKMEALKRKYVGKEHDTPVVRKRLRLEMLALLKHLKYEGHLFRIDGEPFL